MIGGVLEVGAFQGGLYRMSTKYISSTKEEILWWADMKNIVNIVEQEYFECQIGCTHNKWSC